MNLLVNKTARLNYHILDSYEAGIQLTGNEVKSLRSKNGSLKEAYVNINVNNEVFLRSAYIPAFQAQHSRYETYEPATERKLLLSKKEIEKIQRAIKRKGVTIVPLRIFAKKRFLKIEIVVAQGKKQHDKRQDLKDKAVSRDIAREIKNY